MKSKFTIGVAALTHTCCEPFLHRCTEQGSAICLERLAGLLSDTASTLAAHMRELNDVWSSDIFQNGVVALRNKTRRLAVFTPSVFTLGVETKE